MNLPGSTRPLADHLLFQTPGDLLPGYAGQPGPGPGDFPAARLVHATTLKLPVWHREADVPLADTYIAALTKVARHYKDLMQ